MELPLGEGVQEMGGQIPVITVSLQMNIVGLLKPKMPPPSTQTLFSLNQHNV